MEILINTKYDIGSRAMWKSKSGDETGVVKRIIISTDGKEILTKYHVQEDKHKGYVLLSEITNV